MIFQQLSLSYHTSVSGDHHVTTWADRSVSTASIHSDLTSSSREPFLLCYFWSSFNSALLPSFVSSPQTGARVKRKSRLYVRLDAYLYWSDLMVSHRVQPHPVPYHTTTHHISSSLHYRCASCLSILRSESYHACNALLCFALPCHLLLTPIVKRILSPWGLLVALAGNITIQRRKLKKVSPSGSMLVSIPTLPTWHHITSHHDTWHDIKSHHITSHQPLPV